MREVQLKELLTLSRSDQLRSAEQEEIALAIAARLLESFHVAGLETQKLSQQHHRVAFFLLQEARF